MDKPLLILPFDHRSSFKKLIGSDNKQKISDLKKIIFDAFKEAIKDYNDKEHFGLLVDEEHGLEIIKEAKGLGVKIAIPVEKSGQEVFDFEYGENFGEHILNLNPDYVKVLIRYNPKNKDLNQKQLENLKKLDMFCKDKNKDILLELLVPPTQHDLKVAGSAIDYDKELRFDRTLQAINEIKNAVNVSIWKLEGFDQDLWQPLLDSLSKNAKAIVLGRGEDTQKVDQWIIDAAPFEKIIGFAIGRTIFLGPIKGYTSGTVSKEEAVDQICKNYKKYVNMWYDLKKISN